MKTIKRILLAGMFVVCATAMANVEKEVVVNNGEVTINKDSGQIVVSILNTKLNTYTLYIHNPNGEMVFKEELGNQNSLGKRFDFDWALEGNYVFTLRNGEGERTSYTIKTKL